MKRKMDPWTVAWIKVLVCLFPVVVLVFLIHHGLSNKYISGPTALTAFFSIAVVAIVLSLLALFKPTNK